MARTKEENYELIRKRGVNKKSATKLLARFIKFQQTRELMLHWPVTDPLHMQQALALLDKFGDSESRVATDFVVDPIGSKEVYPGTWLVVENRLSRHQEPAGIIQILRKLTDIDTPAELAAMVPLVVQFNEILNLFGLREGEHDWIAFTYRNLTRESRFPCMGFSDPDVVNNIAYSDFNAWATGTVYEIGALVTHSGTRYIALLAHTAGTFATDLSNNKWVAFTDLSYANRRFDDQADGSGNFTLLFRKVAHLKRWATDLTLMGESNAAGTQLTEERSVDQVSATNQAADFTAAQTATQAEQITVMTRLIQMANGERGISATEKKAYTGTTSGDAEEIRETEAIGNSKAAILRVWWRRSATAMATLRGAGGAARSNFTGDVDAATYTHQQLRVNNNGDNTFNVFQLGVDLTTSFWYFPIDTGSETLISAKEGIFRIDTGTEAYAQKLKTIKRQIFSTALGAMQYADGSDAIWTDHATEPKKIRLGWTQYLSSGQHAGFLVQLQPVGAGDFGTDPVANPWTLP